MDKPTISYREIADFLLARSRFKDNLRLGQYLANKFDLTNPDLYYGTDKEIWEWLWKEDCPVKVIYP